MWGGGQDDWLSWSMSNFSIVQSLVWCRVRGVQKKYQWFCDQAKWCLWHTWACKQTKIHCSFKPDSTPNYAVIFTCTFFNPVSEIFLELSCVLASLRLTAHQSVPRPPWIGLVPAHPRDACKIGIWGIWGSDQAPQALCHIPLVIPDQFLWCGSAHSPPWEGVASVTVNLTTWHCRGSFVVFVWMFFRNKSDSHSGLKIRQVYLLRAVFTHHLCYKTTAMPGCFSTYHCCLGIT